MQALHEHAGSTHPASQFVVFPTCFAGMFLKPRGRYGPFLLGSPVEYFVAEYFMARFAFLHSLENVATVAEAGNGYEVDAGHPDYGNRLVDVEIG